MAISDRSPGVSRGQSSATHRRRGARWLPAPLTGGGTDGNEQLTATTGVVLIVLLAVLGITILRIRQLISLHLFLGLLLLGPVALKMASTGYRFVRYYTRDREYRLKGPPDAVLRVLAPGVVASTVVVFASGVVLLVVGPDHRGPFVSIHKVSFIVWLVFIGLHILGHLPRLGGTLRRSIRRDEDGRLSPGAGGRWLALSSALALGAILAILLIPSYGGWTSRGAFPRHHHERAALSVRTAPRATL